MKFNVKALALAGGLVWGCSVLFITYVLTDYLVPVEDDDDDEDGDESETT